MSAPASESSSFSPGWLDECVSPIVEEISSVISFPGTPMLNIKNCEYLYREFCDIYKSYRETEKKYE